MYDNDDTLIGLFVGGDRPHKGYGKMRQYAPGEVIVAAGDPVDHLVMVICGTVLSMRRTTEGCERRYLTASTIEGEQVAAIVGASFFMLRRPSERTYAAGSDCMVVRVDAVKVNDMYNDHKSVQIVRDLSRNSDPEMMRAMRKHLVRESAARGIPGLDPDRPDRLFRVPPGTDRSTSTLYDRVYRAFAARVIKIVLDTRKKAGEALGDATLVTMPVHRPA